MNREKFNFLSWEHRKHVQPETISYISQYDGTDDLRIACTQLDLPAKRQKEEIAEWCSLLPTLENIRSIFFYSRVPQSLFEAACNIKDLESLFIKWSGNGITDFSSLQKLTNLKRLYIASCTKMADLQVLAKLSQLEWFELHELQGLQNIEGLNKMDSLKGLIFTGGQGKQLIFDLDPLKGLSNLEYLDLSSLRSLSCNLEPITHLKKLKYLDLPIYYKMIEYARIYVALPACDHGIDAYRDSGNICDKCHTGQLVYPMDKGRRQICTVCDKIKLDSLKQEFADLVSSIKNQNNT